MTKQKSNNSTGIFLLLTLFFAASLILLNTQSDKETTNTPTSQKEDKNTNTNILSNIVFPENNSETTYVSVNLSNINVRFSNQTPQYKTISIESDETHKLHFTPVNSPNIGGINNKNLQIKDNTYYYEDLYNGIDLIYTKNETSLLEEYEIKTKRKITHLIQKIDLENVTYKKFDDGSYEFITTDTNEKIFSLPKPVMYEKFNTTKRNYGLEYEIREYGGNTFLIKGVNEGGLNWLESANYPVMIDGTVFTENLVLESYGVINNIWTVRADTVGTGMFSFYINPLAEFQALLCGDEEISPLQNTENENIYYIDNYSCSQDTLIKYSLLDSDNYSLNVSFGENNEQTQVDYSIEESNPVFISINQYPIYVQPGDLITVTAEISDINGVTSVTADLGDGLPTIDLVLVTGTNTNGTWHGEWTAVGTGPITYYTQIFATNSLGNITESELIEWSDWSCDLGGDHGGSDFNPVTDCSGQDISGVHTNIGTFSIPSSNIVYVKAYDGADYGNLTINSANADIIGTLSAAGRGYRGVFQSAGEGPEGGAGGGNGCADNAAGGGHGGKGGSATGAGGDIYGNSLEPTTMGSAGGAYACGGTGGNGGGFIKIITSGTTLISGGLSANGYNGASNDTGGGAGGTIYITTGNLSGTGNITANGGNGITGGGGGGGGRIMIKYQNDSSSLGTLTASAGSGGTGPTSGSVIKEDTTNNDLQIKSSHVWFANPTLEGSEHTYRNITVDTSCTLSLIGYYTDETWDNHDGLGFIFTLSNLNIVAGATISANSGGYQGILNEEGDGPGGGAGTGAGCTETGGGGGYGGQGGSATGAGGSVYGNPTAPDDLGSAGGSYGCSRTGGDGGGAIKIDASGTVNVNGTLSANGASGSTNTGGGSGGSVWIITNNLSGTGAITANGANGVNGGGGGGGGRIYIDYVTDNSTLAAKTASAGSGGTGASSGSVLFKNAQNDLSIESSQTWYADPTKQGSDHSFKDLTIASGVTLTLIGYYTDDTLSSRDGVGFNFYVDNLFIESGGAISADAGGYQGVWNQEGDGPGGGAGTGAGCFERGGGGGYGGVGGSASGPGGITYGDPQKPVDLGSAGGAYNCSRIGGNGGGAVRVVARDTIQVNGTIRANGASGGANGGGGSGGSIYLISQTFSGTGAITVNGATGNDNAGGGGGGRVAIYYTYGGPSTLTTLTATPGTGGSGAAEGTIIQVQTHNATLKGGTTIKGGTVIKGL